MNGYYLRFVLAWLVGVGVGCTSAPVHYYTLAAPPDKSLPAAQTALAVDVRVVHIPPPLNRSELIVRAGSSEITLLDNERWASSVSDEIKNAVRLELLRRLGRLSGLRPDFTKLTLDIDVQQLEAEIGQHAVLEASWIATLSATGQRSNGARVTACTFQADEKIHTGYAGIVEGYQREIAALADAIVTTLTGPTGGNDCQKPTEVSAGGAGSKDR